MSFKVTNGKPIHNFPSVNHTNLHRILHHFRDITDIIIGQIFATDGLGTPVWHISLGQTPKPLTMKFDVMNPRACLGHCIVQTVFRYLDPYWCASVRRRTDKQNSDGNSSVLRFTLN